MNLKFVPLFLISSFIVLMSSSVIFAAQGDAWITLSNSTLAPSESFDVEVYMDSVADSIGAFDMYLDFDALDVDVELTQGEDGLSKGADAANYTVIANPDDAANGHYRFAGICAQDCASGTGVHLATIHLKTTAAFNSGTSNLSLRINDLADELGVSISSGTLVGSQISSNVIDESAPLMTLVSPGASLSAGTIQTTLSLTTDENANCKYSTAANVDYAFMTGTFSTTGGALHSVLVTGLSDGSSYNYYVRCMDEGGNENTSDLAVSFAVSDSGDVDEGGGGSSPSPSDSTPAVISGGFPSGNLANVDKTTLSIHTDEDASCRYSTVAGISYNSMTSTFSTTGASSHAVNIDGLVEESSYNYYIRCKNTVGLLNDSDYLIAFTVGSGSSVVSPVAGPVSGNPSDTPSGSTVSNNPSEDFVPKTLSIKDRGMYEKLKGKILLKVEDNGRAYYVHPQTEAGFYLGRPRDAFNVMRGQGVGISSADLEKIPFGLDRLVGEDSDGDGLPDLFEDAIGTDKNKMDTDGDGYNDKAELSAGYSPKGASKLTNDSAFTAKHAGKIFLQVEGSGEAWYIYQEKRYYLGRPAGAFEIMRFLSLGISNSDFDKFSSEE